MTTQECSSVKTQTNEELALHVIESAIRSGVKTFCICPGSRNSPFLTVLKTLPVEKCYWFEERSAAFYCLGIARKTGAPVAVITTSGTAAGELLPATMEAYYSGFPLLLITADRPRCFRGTGAPQAAEQKGIFGVYAPFSQDIAANETCIIAEWDQKSPAHLNVCLEEPIPCKHLGNAEAVCSKELHKWDQGDAARQLDLFFKHVHHPIVVVSTLPKAYKEAVVDFLVQLNAPVILEGISNLREEHKLAHLRIARAEKLWENAVKAGYPIDGVLRIGGVPTVRLWRDLEDKQGQIHVCSISHLPFSGLSWGNLLQVPLPDFFQDYKVQKQYADSVSKQWRVADQTYRQQLHALICAEPTAEASIIFALSQKLSQGSHVYLGNSLPIREWDLVACERDRNYTVCANRGVNGIDGQISTFLGLCQPHVDNWALIGDLTALYDLAGPWVLSQLPDTSVNIVIVNNKGGQIFARMYPDKEFLHSHELSFRSLARFWDMHYAEWSEIPESVAGIGHRLIELTPESEASKRFWNKLSAL